MHMMLLSSITFMILMSSMLSNNNLFLLTKIMLTKFSSMSLSINMMMDWMSMMFLSVVIMISSLIIIFSKYYITKNEFKQFLVLLLMFVLSMSVLIISNNLFLILLGWDGLGLSSYILVIYYQNFQSASSGTITLLSNRMGDIMILMSMGLLMLTSNWDFNFNNEYSLLVMILLTMAACSKSAQFPFSAWLPMAMAAPTPISALVHSSTLVTAGVFLMLRIISSTHMFTNSLILIISSATAIYASMSANWEQDLKKIIALSTLSQIAMMMFAIALNSLILAFMHLIIHALFKSAMFLCAGVMIHESSYQDMRMMNINFINYPLTLSMLGVNSMALMGIPFMSGFFSKDTIIEYMMMSNLNIVLLMLMTMSIGMTASYSIRMSLMSNKSNIKSNPMSHNHSSVYALMPTMMLSLFAITSGSWLTWLLSPTQSYLINYSNKIMINMMLLSGFLLGFLLQFKSKNYIKLGLSSISIWFNHFISILPMNFMFPTMSIFQNNDKTWQENYGPEKSFNLIKLSSSTPDKIKTSLLMSIIMLSLIPMMIL